MNSLDTAHLEREIEVLRERLEEAEDMRRAISHNEVDAFVVGHSDDDKKVLLLAGAYSRYRQLIDEMQHGTVTVSRSGDVLFANQRFASLLGVPLGELFRASFATYVAADDRAAVSALLTTPASDDDGIEVALLSQSGPVRCRVTVVSSWEQYATLVVTDIARERLVEEAQQTIDAIRRGEVDAFVIGGETVMTLSTGHRDPYQVLADRIQQGALTVSSADTVIYANDKLCRMLGIRIERLLGTDFLSYFAASDRETLAGLMNGNNANGRSGGQAEVKMRRVDGSAVPALVSVTPLADGRRMCLVTDLSERRRHQASDERNRQFLGMLAHEFRNMLSTTRNAVEVLKRHELNAECVKALGHIERQSQRMLELVDDLRRVNPKE